jgi:Cu+-exporting ATPase
MPFEVFESTSQPIQLAPAASCLHCGEICDAGHVRNDAGVFCCAGCEAVHRLITLHGLQDFYTCEIAPGRSQKNLENPERFAVLDDPGVASRFVSALAGGRLRATFSVPAMHCSSCLWLLERLWRLDAGIGRSEADVLTRTVRIEFDPSVTSVRAVAELLASTGYAPVLDAEQAADAPPSSRRSLYLKIGVAGFAFGNVMLFSIPRYVNGGPLDPAFARLFGILNLVFAVPVLVYSASDYFKGAARALRTRTISLDVPIAIGLIALFARSAADIGLGLGEGFLDSFAGLVFFLLIGRLFQQRAFERIEFDRTVRSFLPLSVQATGRHHGSLTPIDLLEPGDTIALRPGEVVPADSTLLDATARVDYAFVTGEQSPVDVRGGTEVHAGGRIVDRTVELRVDGRVSHSRLARLWANPVFRSRKATWLTDVLARFGFWFTVAAVGMAAVGAVAWWPDWRMALQVATAVLIIACPCAFTLAAPITLGTAMGVLGRYGVYLRQPAVTLDLSRIDTVVFDKTGTLTTASTTEAVCEGLSARDWSLVRMLAAQSTHPVSRAISRGHRDDAAIQHLKEISGRGLTGWIDGHRVVLGSAAFIAAETGRRVPTATGATWASVDGGRPGWIRLAAAERPGVETAAGAVGNRAEIWLLSGDDASTASRWAPVFGDRMRFSQTPDDKLAVVRELKASGRRVLMIGDGLNDAGALAAADVGFGVTDDTACLVPACDGIVSGSRLSELPALLAYARRARKVIVLCFAISIVYNVFGLSLALAGLLTPLVTAILMPVSSLTIVGLSAGLMRRGPRWSTPR